MHPSRCAAIQILDDHLWAFASVVMEGIEPQLAMASVGHMVIADTKVRKMI